MGNKTAVTGAAVATFGYTGREPDASGLTYYRARYYDPASRRFTQRDPIGFGGGLNQYAYVGNNPVNFTDPSGLLPTGPSNSGGTSYPGNSSPGCQSQFTPGEEQTATDAVAEGIDFSYGPVLVAGTLQCISNVAPGMLGAGLPGYPGLQQQPADPYGIPGFTDVQTGTPPSALAAALNGLINGVTHPVDTVRDFFNNLGNLILNEAGSGDKHPSTPTGNRGSPIEVKPGTNKPATIGGRDYTGHGLDRMQGRGIPPSAVEEAIQNGKSSPGNQPGTTVHTGWDGVTVVTGEGGRVITVIPR